MNGNGARVVRVNGSLVEIESLDRVGLLDLVAASACEIAKAPRHIISLPLFN